MISFLLSIALEHDSFNDFTVQKASQDNYLWVQTHNLLEEY